ELQHMLADIRAGAPRKEAMSTWAERCDLPAMRHFVAAVAQADQFGMSLGPVLRAQADQRRNERFLRAEKLAQEAPVKMMFPLIFCIFPCTFLIIAFPIAAKFLELLERLPPRTPKRIPDVALTRLRLSRRFSCSFAASDPT